MNSTKEFAYLRSSITCTLNALERDGKDGKPVRKEMADELRKAFGNFIEAAERATEAGTPAKADDWTVDDTDVAAKIMLLLGTASTGSREPGADRLRDRVAAIIRKYVEATTPAALVATSEQRKLAAAEFDRQFPPPTTDMRCDEYDALEAQRRVEWNAWWSAWQARTTSTSEATGG